MLYCLYRISDKGNSKNKLKNASKINCLNNFINVFGIKNLIVFADNCEKSTINMLNHLNLNVIETSLGNSGTLLYSINYSINNFKETDYVYLVEDDYFHKKSSKKILLEGLKISDYVSLYDHPDKYQINSINPFVKDGGENSKVLLTKSCHWKTTNSTTMTFGSTIKVLKEDYEVFKMFSSQDVPNDFYIFRILTKNFIGIRDEILFKNFKLKKRILVSAIPSFCTHCEVEYLAPLTNWEKY